MRKQLIAGAAVGIVAVAGVALPASAISATTADLTVVHGIPGTPVDVYVNDELTLDNFEFGSIVGPLDLPAGTYSVAITAADAADASAPIIGPVDLPLAANTSYSAVAHFNADGDPTATLFTNDLSAAPAGQGRLTVRHTAAAPAVDILANGAAAFSNVTNPQEGKANLPVGTISAAVALAGTTEPVIGPQNVAIEAGVNRIVYAVGSAEAGNLSLIVQAVSIAATPPTSIPSGEAGLAADPDMTPIVWGGIALLVLAGAVTVVTLRTRRAGSEL